MKHTGVCPKCGSKDVVAERRGIESHRYFVLPRWWLSVKSRRYACGACGYAETWIDDLDELREARSVTDGRSYLRWLRGRFAWARRRRVRQGLCAFCGYDLRASPERCPECGRSALGSNSVVSGAGNASSDTP